MTTAIEAVDLFKIHRTPEGDAAALQGLSFTVEEGELVALLGPSGSGKSTLIRVLAGLERPSAGTAWVLGSELGRLGARRVAALRSAAIGVVHQEDGRALPPNLTVQEAVALPARLDGSRRRAALADAAALLAELGLGDRASDATTVLSGGERQRVALAAALVRRPRLILADEPAGELDDANAALVHDLLRAAATDHGATVLVTSHDPTTAERADRTVRIVDGRVAESRGGGEPFSPLVDGRGWLRLPDALWRRSHGPVPVDVTGSDGELVLRRHDGAPLRPAADERADAPPPRPGAVVGRLLGVRRGFADGDRRREVVDGFDLDLVGGLVTCLRGRSGTGKSTLLRLLAAVDDPDEGRVELAGVDVAPLDRAARAALRRDVLGVVEQDPGVVPFLTALENVVLDAALVAPRSAAGELEREARRWLERVGLEHRIDHRTWRLSAGERQRVAIARALVRGPRLLLLDEPTSRLDAASTIVVADLVLACARSTGAAVVVATHEQEVVDRCDVVVELPPPCGGTTGPTLVTGTTVH